MKGLIRDHQCEQFINEGALQTAKAVKGLETAAASDVFTWRTRPAGNLLAGRGPLAQLSELNKPAKRPCVNQKKFNLKTSLFNCSERSKDLQRAFKEAWLETAKKKTVSR